MEKWEIRYLHELAVIESLYEMHDKILPKQPYGMLHYNMNLHNKPFHGKKFFAALNKRNHTTATFENCECYKDYVKN